MSLQIISLMIFPTFKWAGKGELLAEGPVVLGNIVEDRRLAAILTSVGFFRAQISLMIFNVRPFEGMNSYRIYMGYKQVHNLLIEYHLLVIGLNALKIFPFHQPTNIPCLREDSGYEDH